MDGEEEIVEVEDKEYILTFGFGQVNQNKYWRFTANDYEQAREQVIRNFGMEWSQIYSPPNAVAKSMVLEFGFVSELK